MSHLSHVETEQGGSLSEDSVAASTSGDDDTYIPGGESARDTATHSTISHDATVLDAIATEEHTADHTSNAGTDSTDTAAGIMDETTKSVESPIPTAAFESILRVKRAVEVAERSVTSFASRIDVIEYLLESAGSEADVDLLHCRSALRTLEIQIRTAISETDKALVRAFRSVLRDQVAFSAESPFLPQIRQHEQILKQQQTLLQDLLSRNFAALGLAMHLLNEAEEQKKLASALEISKPVESDHLNDRVSDREIIERRTTAWPEGLGNEMRQGEFGDCYIVTALFLAKGLEDAGTFLPEMLRPERSAGGSESSDAGWNVRLFNRDTDEFEWIFVAREDIDRDHHPGLSVGSLGDHMIERACSRLINLHRGGNPGETMDERVEIVRGEARVKRTPEGGWPHYVLEMILGPSLDKHRIHDPHDKRSLAAFDRGGTLEQLQMIAEDRRSGTNEVLAMAATVHEIAEPVQTLLYTPHESPPSGWKKFMRIFSPAYGKEWERLVSNHAYGIDNYLAAEHRVILVNPHHTSRRAIIPESLFLEWFRDISTVRKSTEEKFERTATRHFPIRPREASPRRRRS